VAVSVTPTATASASETKAMGARVIIILALALALQASPAGAQVIYQPQPDGSVLVIPLDPRQAPWLILPAPGPYPPQLYQPYYNPNSPYPPESYFEQYRRGGSAGCVYGCSDH
jgi:hypothetical protein